jgi:hypothetical protein
MLYNINPNIWGPHCWKFLHFLTLSYPDNPTEQDKNNIKQFIFSLENVLPCEKCRYHFGNNLKNFPITDNIISSRYNLINWLRNVHNEVNSRNNKKQYSYDDLLKEYNINSEKSDIGVEIITVILLILIILIIAIYLIKFR